MKTIVKNKKYHCLCGCDFEADAIYISEGKQSISNQIKCPKCLNLIPTWEKELTGKTIGQKHIHIRK